MTKESLIIIGAGLAGLSTGCYAQMNGYQSHIFEHCAAFLPASTPASTWYNSCATGTGSRF